MSMAGAADTRSAVRGADFPIVDVARADEAAAAQQVYKCCTESGFFYVTNHGVPAQLVADVFAQLRAAFALPAEEKQRLLADENNRGYTPFAEETLDPAHQSRGDTKEGFYFGREVPADSPEAALPLHGPNQWPAEALLPGFRQTVSAYIQAQTQLAFKLLRLLALALQLPADFFHAMHDKPMLTLRPLHYSAEVSAPTEGVFGCGAHSDYGMLTILATDDVPGLQAHVHGSWHDVRPIPGTFIINLGDMLERWTNGLFKSTVHRVVNTSGRERYSCAFFLDPNFDAVVEALPSCVSAERPAAYPPTTAGAHLLAKYAVTHEGYDVNQKAARLQQPQVAAKGGAARGAPSQPSQGVPINA